MMSLFKTKINIDSRRCKQCLKENKILQQMCWWSRQAEIRNIRTGRPELQIRGPTPTVTVFNPSSGYSYTKQYSLAEFVALIRTYPSLEYDSHTAAQFCITKDFLNRLILKAE
jgi:hypothetical protein